MLNPSYLIKSRHDIYYFRYPLPVSQCGAEKRVSISLRTRCPREALRLAKALEYHSVNLIKGMDFNLMNHAEILSLLKDHYSEVLDRSKAQIDENGMFSKKKKEGIERYIKQLDEMIANDSDSFDELIDGEPSAEDGIHDELKSITDKYELELDSNEYEMMKRAYKHVRRNHFIDLLKYNSQVFDYSLLSNAQGGVAAHISHNKLENRLGNVIRDYLDEKKSNLNDRNYNAIVGYLNYLIDWLGADFPVTKVEHKEVQEIKNNLRRTPLGRNKGDMGKLKLKEQIAHAKEHKLEVLSGASVNNYLGSFSSFFKWVKRNKIVDENPFEGIFIDVNKKGQRRDLFSDDEIMQIIQNLGDGTRNERVKHTTYYWGALIAIYTGARRNEIASLLPSDIKYDTKSEIWYFNITDEEDCKHLKTPAARRIVPVHSKLIELGFLDYVEHAREYIQKHPKVKTQTGEYDTRLLYDLTYEDHDKWGRKLGRWFNENYLKKIGLKEKKKSLHSLRHSLITSMSAAEVEHATIRAIVGHEAGTVTEKHYIHYDPKHLPAFQKAIEKLSY